MSPEVIARQAQNIADAARASVDSLDAAVKAAREALIPEGEKAPIPHDLETLKVMTAHLDKTNMFSVFFIPKPPAAADRPERAGRGGVQQQP